MRERFLISFVGSPAFGLVPASATLNSRQLETTFAPCKAMHPTTSDNRTVFEGRAANKHTRVRKVKTCLDCSLLSKVTIWNPCPLTPLETRECVCHHLLMHSSQCTFGCITHRRCILPTWAEPAPSSTRCADYSRPASDTPTRISSKKGGCSHVYTHAGAGMQQRR